MLALSRKAVSGHAGQRTCYYAKNQITIYAELADLSNTQAVAVPADTIPWGPRRKGRKILDTTRAIHRSGSSWDRVVGPFFSYFLGSGSVIRLMDFVNPRWH